METREDNEDIKIKENQNNVVYNQEIISKHIEVKTEKFEGPFDLLYHLIKKNQIDIYDIPINLLTEQYLESIKDEEKIDMDNMSEFLLMAATLIEIKSKLLIPKNKSDEDEVDAREELANKILEYQYFKTISEVMAEQFKNPIITKSKDLDFIKQLDLDEVIIPETEELLEGVTLEKLYNVFRDVVLRQENKVDKVRSNYGKIKREQYTIEGKKDYIRTLLKSEKEIIFFDIFSENSTKSEKIATFLAILELIKIREVSVLQKDNFGDIIIVNNHSNDKGENEDKL